MDFLEKATSGIENDDDLELIKLELQELETELEQIAKKLDQT